MTDSDHNLSEYLSSLLSILGCSRAACIGPKTAATAPLAVKNVNVAQDEFWDGRIPEGPFDVIGAEGAVLPLDGPCMEALAGHLVSGGVLLLRLSDVFEDPAVQTAPSRALQRLHRAGWVLSLCWPSPRIGFCVASPTARREDVLSAAQSLAGALHRPACVLGDQGTCAALRGPVRPAPGGPGLETVERTELYLFNPNAATTVRVTGRVDKPCSLTTAHPLARICPLQQPPVADGSWQVAFKIWLPTGGTIVEFLSTGGARQGMVVHELQLQAEAQGPLLQDAFWELAPDLYQRHRQAADLVQACLGEQPGKTVLDVGGGNCLMAMMLPQYEWTVADLNPIDHPAFQRLPWKKIRGHFDAAVCLDVFEHIPPALRPPFLRHIASLADTLILAGPFQDPTVEWAEGELNARLATLYPHGHQFLEEHVVYGLPDLRESASCLAPLLPHQTVLTGQSVMLWLISTALYLMADSSLATQLLARCYSRQVNRQAPDGGHPYRRYLVASRNALPDLPRPPEPAGPVNLDSLLTTLQAMTPVAALLRLSNDSRRTREDLNGLMQQSAGMLQQVTDRLGEPAGRSLKRQQAEWLEEQVGLLSQRSRTVEDLLAKQGQLMAFLSRQMEEQGRLLAGLAGVAGPGAPSPAGPIEPAFQGPAGPAEARPPEKAADADPHHPS